MQNLYPTAGTIPAVDPSSWNSSPDLGFSPRSAGSSKSHDAVVARRHNAQVRLLLSIFQSVSFLPYKGPIVRLWCCYRRVICVSRRRPNANSKDPTLLVSSVCAVIQNASLPRDERNVSISKGMICSLFLYLHLENQNCRS